MNLPASLAAALAAADEAYLIGLSNKGTVNRARKDLAAGPAPEARVDGEEVEVRVSGAVCRIRAPLGDSRCSCPGSGVCRHRIAAILWLQQHTEPTKNAPPKPAFAQLRAYPAQKLARQLGPRRLAAALFRHQSGADPVITETTVVTVEMPWLPATVRLLEPLEHSTCTCHSKDFCLHKAEALLCWQLARGVADPAALAVREEERRDAEAVRGVCRAVQQALTGQMTVGLSRLPRTACDTVERMAALCHTARLPALERALRALHQEYSAYFARSAAFRDTVWLQRMARVFRLAAALENADADGLRELAGVFREEYEPVGALKLYLLGLRDVSRQSGYEGTRYYFWEREAHRFYLFSDVRPTFYEGSPRRRGDAVPWGLPRPLRQVWNCALDLTGARVSRGGSLSSTDQCRAVLLGARNPGRVFPPEEVFTDFARLLAERSAPGAPEIERLAVVRPAACRVQEYDPVRQVFSLQLLDHESRDLWVELGYRKEETPVLDELERLARWLQEQPGLRPVFFGAVYREDDRLKFYPIEYFTNWEGCV